MKNNIAFFENGSWYHRTKTLNNDYTVKYGKKGGFKTKEEAEESFQKYDNEFKSKILGNTNDLNNQISFKEYLIYWYENIFIERIENTTQMISAYILYNIIIPNIDKDIQLRFVTKDYLSSLFDKILGIYSEQTARKTQEIINIAFKDALFEKRINYNPMSEITFIKRTKNKIIILSKNEIKKFLSYVCNDNWYLEILLALFCGLIKGEIEGLKFSDFNIKEKTVEISRQVVANYSLENGMEVKGFKIKEYSIKEGDPKTINSFRKLRVPDIIIEQLNSRKKLMDYYKQRYKIFEDNDYISCQKNGKPHSLSAFNNYLNRICKKNGLPKITVHGLRHMYATILIENDVELVTISALLGHNSVNTTFEYYCDVMEEDGNINSYLNTAFVS